ncbi:Metallo-dependent phosphatase [Pholiota conissans]|uniref:Sphingomyelin phosphodiesterase n=1 Tax=Pholiota conissans TaxID=109636 RepID=A0A9P5ZF89_9AGAR|nr:Metallo-dependent phosphatase [Pholiota conissans]
MRLARLLSLPAVAGVGCVSGQLITPSTFTVAGPFPTSVFSKYYNSPTATSAQPQPVVSDPVLHEVFPLALTDPNRIPINDTADPHPLPPVVSSSQLFSNAITQLHSIATSPIFVNDKCGQCQAILGIAKFVSMATPSNGPAFFTQFCNTFKLASNCTVMYGQFSGIGSVITQVVANADTGGYDGQALCQNFFNMCPAPPTVSLNLTGWFAKPKPSPLPARKKPSGERLKVLHLSDFHLDPRFATGAEANCTSGTCCRSNNHNSMSLNQVLMPAPRYGAYRCDTPMALALAALEAVPELTGTKNTGFAFTVYTGDLVSHDPDNQLSRCYVEYTEAIVYDLFKRLLGSGPVYAALGNHDSYNQAQDAPHSIGGKLAEQFSWNYGHVAGLWEQKGWIPQSAVAVARAHYAGYMVKRVDGLRIITLNTDMCREPFSANYFNYINMTNPDTSGMLRFLTDELQDAEDTGDRVWIIGHVLTGWDGTNPLRNPTNLFYQIVDRFSPHVIANIFFGHTHEDQINIFYSNNGTVMSAETAGALSWIGPSVTPLTNLNSGFRVYEVDSATFDILDAHTWRADVNSFHSLDSQTALGPTYAYEYNTRETYGNAITGWGPNDPLNATWWHHVTEAMEANSSLVTTFNTFQGKGSVLSPACTDECITAKICYIRSGSVSIALQNCPAGFGSVQ